MTGRDPLFSAVLEIAREPEVDGSFDKAWEIAAERGIPGARERLAERMASPQGQVEAMVRRAFDEHEYDEGAEVVPLRPVLTAAVAALKEHPRAHELVLFLAGEALKSAIVEEAEERGIPESIRPFD